ncbi:MAG: MFS transporter [Pseudomonadota bacterium]
MIVSAKSKTISIGLLVVAEILALAAWFSSAAVLADMSREAAISPLVRGMLASGTQAGFAIGAVVFAVLGLSDRFDPRRVFAMSAIAAAAANAALLVAPIGGGLAVASRVATGAFLAGVYPVGMKIAVGWGTHDRGLLVGLLVGALTLGSAAPYLLSFISGADWRGAVAGASILTAAGGFIILLTNLGPHHAQARAFSPIALRLAWRDRRIRLAYAGYLGHMWELYAMWAWVGAGLAASFALQLPDGEALALSKVTAFAAVAVGAMACVAAGLLADRIGKAETTIIAMVGSGASALLAALVFDGPPALMIVVVVIWGAFVIADSAQFSALVADVAPTEHTGSLLTLQTALGFALTVITVQGAPLVAGAIGWPGLFVVLAAGPLFGTVAMMQLRTIMKESSV